MNLKMLKLDFKKAKESEIKLPTSIGSQKKQESSRKTSALLTTPKPLTVDYSKLWKILRNENAIPPYLPSVCRSGSNS